MNQTFDQLLATYDYQFPQELIAKQPAHPRDSARLLVFDRKNDSVTFDTFANIDHYLPPNAVLVMNQTKVIPAKMTLTKITGGIVSALLLSVQPETITVIASGTLKPGEKLIWKGGHSFSVIHRNQQEALLKPSFPFTQLRELLETYGETPLPPYMKDSPLTETERREEYQTIFARDPGSVAAPTAGLHFTEDLIKKIAAPRTLGGTGEQSGRSISYISLHVGLGTFAQITEDQVKTKKLHLEYYSIDPATATALTDSKKSGRPIIAVGTTTVRTLESATLGEDVRTTVGSTDLFITETYKPHFVDGLITNFHVPRSSLLMLVSAFTDRERLLQIYQQAIKERMRLFSFGDGMLII